MLQKPEERLDSIQSARQAWLKGPAKDPVLEVLGPPYKPSWSTVVNVSTSPNKIFPVTSLIIPNHGKR